MKAKKNKGRLPDFGIWHRVDGCIRGEEMEHSLAEENRAIKNTVSKN